MSAPVCAAAGCENLGVYKQVVNRGTWFQTVYLCPDHKTALAADISIVAGASYWYDGADSDDRSSAGEVLGAGDISDSRHRPVKVPNNRGQGLQARGGPQQ